MDKPTIIGRNSSVELLRIISMLFIVLSHSCVHGGFVNINNEFTFNSVIVQWGTLGNLGVDIFVLISGYYMCRKQLSVSNVTKLLSQVWFYSILMFGICVGIFGYDYSIVELIKVFLPTIFGEYWFFTAYIVLLVFTPFVNKAINAISQYEFKILILTMIMLWVIIPTFTAQRMYGTELLQLLLFYVIGAYFSHYEIIFLKNRRNRYILTAISFGLMFLSTVALDIVAQYIGIFSDRGTIFYERNSLLTLGCAVGLFASAIYKEPYTSKTINKIATNIFGVYLIHDNPVFRYILWQDIIRNQMYFHSDYLIVRIFISVIIVFLACICVEYIRQKTIKKYFDAVFERIGMFFVKIVKKYL